MQRLCLTGFLMWQSHQFLRLTTALLLSLSYMLLLLSLRPYVRTDVALLATAAQFALVLIFFGAIVIKVFQDVEVSLDVPTAERGERTTSSNLRVRSVD